MIMGYSLPLIPIIPWLDYPHDIAIQPYIHHKIQVIAIIIQAKMVAPQTEPHLGHLWIPLNDVQPMVSLTG